VHDVFYVSLLKPYHYQEGDPIEDHEEPDLEEDASEVWEVEKIIAQRTQKGKREYLLR